MAYRFRSLTIRAIFSISTAWMSLACPGVRAQSIATALDIPTPGKAVELRIQQKRVLTLDKAIELALDRNPSIFGSRAGIEQARGGQDLALATLNPVLNFASSSLVKLSIEGDNALGGTSDTGSFNSWTGTTVFGAPSVGLNFSWTAYSSGLVQLQVASADYSLRVATLDLERRIQDLKANVIRSYIQLQKARDTVEIAGLGLSNAQATLSDTQALVKAGEGTRFEEIRSQVRVLDARRSVREAQGTMAVAQRQLAELLNFPVPTEVIPEDPTGRWGAPNTSLEESIFKAFANRVELQQDRAREQLALTNKLVAQAQLGPQLKLVGSLGYQNNFNFINAATVVGNGPAQLSAATNYNQNLFAFSMAAQLVLPLSDGGISAASARQAQAAADVARFALIEETNALRLQVETAFEQLSSSSDEYTIGVDQLKQAELALDYARQRFRAGIGTQLEVFDAESELIQAKNSVLAATLGYNQAFAELRRSTGEL